MKKSIYTLLALVAAAAIMGACSKDNNFNGGNKSKTVTITASIPEEGLQSKVTLSQDAIKTAVKVAWDDDDIISVNGETFTIDPASIKDNGKTAKFTGSDPGAGPYNISYTDISNIAEQTQSADGNLDHLRFAVSLTGANSYASFSFTEAWATAHGATYQGSSVLELRALLPDDIKSSVQKVIFTFPEEITTGNKSIAVTLGNSALEADGKLDVYATLPAGNIPLSNILVQFQVSGDANDKYSAYREYAVDNAIPSGSTYYLGLNCTNIMSYANASSTNIGESTNPYFVGDKHQLLKVKDEMIDDATVSFKMVGDVNMTGESWTHLNAGSGFKQLVNFDGNGKTISNLNADFFYVFKGAIQNLTLSGSNVGTKRGIFAEFCQGTGHIITNVDIIDGAMATNSANGGALIGQINNGTADVTSVTITDCDVTNTTVSGAANTGGLIGRTYDETVIENCTVSGSNVTGTGVVGGVVGFAESKVTISGCKYTGGTVTSSGRYVGGFLGSTKDLASVITDCQVEDATISTTYNDDSRGGGFVGQLQTSCRVEGCTVGTPSAKVTVNTVQPKRTGSGTEKDPYVYSKINSGGFVGVNYGTITKNGDVRCKAYVKVTSTNTYGTPLDLGGFVGYGRGTIEYSDAIIDMTSLKGQYIGGFAGYVVNAGTVIDHCTVDGPVTGNNFTGGFAGYVDSGAPGLSNCTASGSVTAQSGCGGFVGQTMTGVFTACSTSATCSFSGSNNGGFAGQIHGGTLSECSESGSVTSTSTGTTFGGFVGLIPDSCTLDKCSATGNVTSNAKSYFGGFIGAINNGPNILIKRCWATGNVTSDSSYASAFIGNINEGVGMEINATIQNCYATGKIINSNQVRGGLIAAVVTATSVTVSNCYTSGAVVGSFRIGGLIGNIATANVSVDHCAAWNSEVTASYIGSGNWSTGAVVGTAFPTCTLTDNYRKPGMSVKSFWGNVTGYTYALAADFSHDNVSSSNPLKDYDDTAMGDANMASGQAHYPWYPYHGKVEAGKTLSQLASTTLGWSSEIWDFSGELPTLR